VRRWEVNVKMNTKATGCVNVDSNWLKKGATGGVLWTRYWNVWFRKRREISGPDERLTASQWLCAI
jgi:hypothetical protein